MTLVKAFLHEKNTKFKNTVFQRRKTECQFWILHCARQFLKVQGMSTTEIVWSVQGPNSSSMNLYLFFPRGLKLGRILSIDYSFHALHPYMLTHDSHDSAYTVPYTFIHLDKYTYTSPRLKKRKTENSREIECSGTKVFPVENSWGDR